MFFEIPASYNNSKTQNSKRKTACNNIPYKPSHVHRLGRPKNNYFGRVAGTLYALLHQNPSPL
jgi:hypothetical protein